MNCLRVPSAARSHALAVGCVASLLASAAFSKPPQKRPPAAQPVPSGAQPLLVDKLDSMDNYVVVHRMSLADSDEGGYARQQQNGKTFFASRVKSQADFDFCLREHNRGWERFKASHAQFSQQEFVAFKKENDPFCFQYFQQIAPRLRFDLVARGEASLILESITVETLEFSEYKGGGFAAGETAYDLRLRHNVGSHNYPIPGKQLKLVDRTGSVAIRFFSDNYYPDVGWMTPLGQFRLRICFNFIVDAAKKTTACSEEFYIDA